MIVPEEISLFLRLLIAHLLTEFVFQSASWTEERKIKPLRSGKLYLHAGITALTAYLLAGLWTNLWLPLTIFLSHLAIDIWKSARPARLKYFIARQFMHLLVLFLVWLAIFDRWDVFAGLLKGIYNNNHFLAIVAGYITVTWPLGILIGIATERWRNEPGVNTDGLANAGMWIGFFERFLIFTFIMIDQYTAIGLLIAAKSVLRFNDKENTTQKKTEYVLIGTLMSFSASLLMGIAIEAISRFI